MVVRWGMSSAVGPLNLAEPEGDGLLPQRPYSEHTAELIDAEMKRIVEECIKEACALLNEHRRRLDALTQALLRDESLDEAEVLRIAGLQRDAEGRVHVAGEPVFEGGPQLPSAPEPPADQPIDSEPAAGVAGRRAEKAAASRRPRTPA
jgi:hypothetical protein